MAQQQQSEPDPIAPMDASLAAYPHGRGYGHDYMRGGEVLGGYGYSERAEYARRRGESNDANADAPIALPQS